MSWWRRSGALVVIVLACAAAIPSPAADQTPGPSQAPRASAGPAGAAPTPTQLLADAVPGGLLWQAAAAPLTPAGTTLTYLTSWRRGFAAVQMRDDRAVAIWSSEDGSTWATSALPSGARAVQGLVAFDGGLTLIVFPGTDSLPEPWAFEVWRSDDATHWAHVGRLVADLPTGLRDCQVNDRRVSVAHGRLVAIAAVCRDLCCGIGPVPDGPGLATIGSAATQVTARGGTYVWTSPTGRVWTRHRARGVADGSGFEFLSSVTRTVDGLLGLRYGTLGSLLRSADGVAWQEVGPLPDGFDMDAWYAIAATPNGYVLAGALGDVDVPRIWTGTPDGAWTSTLQLADRTYVTDLGVSDDTIIASGSHDVAAGDALFIAHPLILVSLDGGSTWDAAASWIATADDWPLAEDSCLGPLAVAIQVAVLVGCPAGTAAVFATDLPVHPPGVPEPSGSAPSGPTLGPAVSPPPGPSPTVVPSGPPTAQARADGATLEVWLPTGNVASGAWLPAHVRITNHRQGPIFFPCGPVGVEAGLAALFPPGRTWTGSRATFKQQVLQRLRTIFDLVQPCPIGDSGYFERLGPGRSRDYDLLALPRYPVADQPLPSGMLSITTRFSFGTTSYGTPTHDLDAAATVDLAGPAWDHPGPSEVIDAALADPQFGTWVAQRDLTGDWDLDVRSLDGPDGDMYRGFVGYLGPGPAHQVYIELDAGSDFGGGSVGRVLLDPLAGTVLATSFGP